MDNRSLVFFTIHNILGEQNPRSALVIEALTKQEGCVASVLASQADARGFLELAKRAVVLFDSDSAKVNHWKPQLTSEKGTPSWALAATWSVRIGKRCVTSPACVKRCAKQLKRLFENVAVNKADSNHLPWGPVRTAKKRRCRPLRAMRQDRWSHLVW